MPVLTGVVVESSAQSDRRLRDFRETISDLISSQHIQQVLNQWHLQHYCESDEGGRAFVADGMEVKKDCQVPMGAMWTQSPGVNKIEYNALGQFAPYKRIVVPAEETYAANCIRVNDRVLFAAGYPRTAAQLIAAGFDPLLLEMSEFQKMDGGLSCLSLRF